MNNNTTYRPLGKYIRQVDVRNKDICVNKLLGVSISKVFIPSIANIVGTNMSNYKIITRGQFAYGPVTSRNGEKISIALALEDEAIISQAYTVFEIIEGIVPEYLMMWFRRPEFDRYARYHSHGSVREIFSWDDMCETLVPVPSIAEQQAIVDEYETIARRIRINEQLITKLEQTAQTLYRHMFVDNIDKENLPQGWRMGTLTEIAEYTNGLACQNYEAENSPSLPVLKIRELNQGFTDSESNQAILDVPKKCKIYDGDLIFSWSATLMIDFWCGGKAVLNQHLFKITSCSHELWFCYLATKQHIDSWKNIIAAKATSMGHIKREDLESALVVIPKTDYLDAANQQMKPIFDLLLLTKKELLINRELQSLLLTKMGQ